MSDRVKKKPTYVSHHQAYPILSFIWHHTSTAIKTSYSSLASITCITYALHQEHMYPHPCRHVIHTNTTNDRTMICPIEYRRSTRTSAITKPILSYPILHSSSHILLRSKPRIRPSPLSSHALLTGCTKTICIHIQTDTSFTPTPHMTG